MINNYKKNAYNQYFHKVTKIILKGAVKELEEKMKFEVQFRKLGLDFFLTFDKLNEKDFN